MEQNYVTVTLGPVKYWWRGSCPAGHPRGLNKPQEAGGLPAFPLVAVGRRDNVAEGLRESHEGESEVHVLHHWREQGRRRELCLRREAAQTWLRGATVVATTVKPA